MTTLFLVFYDKTEYTTPYTPISSWLIYSDTRERAIELVALYNDIPCHQLNTKELNLIKKGHNY